MMHKLLVYALLVAGAVGFWFYVQARNEEIGRLRTTVDGLQQQIDTLNQLQELTRKGNEAANSVRRRIITNPDSVSDSDPYSRD